MMINQVKRESVANSSLFAMMPNEVTNDEVLHRSYAIHFQNQRPSPNNTIAHFI